MLYRFNISVRELTRTHNVSRSAAETHNKFLIKTFPKKFKYMGNIDYRVDPDDPRFEMVGHIHKFDRPLITVDINFAEHED